MRKYKDGKQICSILEFEESRSQWFMWNGKTTHRIILENLQYRVLKQYIVRGFIKEATKA